MAAGRSRVLSLDPAIKDAALWTLDVADFYNVPVTVVSAFRSLEDQARLRANYDECVRSGRTGQAPDCLFPANRSGESAHNFGLAFDSVTEPRFRAWWTMVRQFAGFRVLENDWPHAELPDWRIYV